MVVHLAGNRVVIGERVIQRCLICGERVADNLYLLVPENPDRPPFFTWPVGGWIKFEGTSQTLIRETTTPEFGPTETPEGCCIDLVEL